MKLAGVVCVVVPVAAQFGSFFEQFMHQKQQPQQQQLDMESLYHQVECNEYLCEDTLKCVAKPLDCPCPFEASQLKCILPDKSKYVCISKPSTEDGPTCEFVNKAFYGKV